MSRRSDSKGLSTIVATLLIILLTLVAVGIIWIVVRNVVQGGSEQISLGKFTLDLKISQVQKINDSALNLRVKRDAGNGEFVGINFIVEDDSNTEIVKINDSLKELETKNFQLYFLTINASRVKKISIAPIFKLESGKEVVGDVKDEYISSTSSGTGGTTCTPNCAGRVCGADPLCGQSCGNCTGGQICNVTGRCVTNCTDSCLSLNYTCGYHTICGNNISCGTCTGGQICNVTGRCIASVPIWQTGMVSWWKFNGNANDFFGINNGNVSGATLTSTECKSEQCYSFDGVNDYIDAVSSNSLNPQSSNFTISVWFKLGATGSINGHILYNKENLYEASAGGGYFTYAWQPDWNWDGGTSFPVNVGVWYNAVIVYDGVKQYVYNNGVQVYSRSQIGIIGTNSNPFRIGARGGVGSPFNGSIDEVMIWNRALNSTEIQQIYSYSYP